MFAVHCPNHFGTGNPASVLLGLTDVEGVVNATDGIRVSYRCTCGVRGTWHTGRHQPQSDL